MKTLRKILDHALEKFCIGLFCAMVLFVLWQIFTRYALNSPSPYSETISRYLFVWLVMFGSAYVFGKREHMNITFIRDMMSAKVKVIVEIFTEVLIVVFASAVMVFGGFVQSKMQMIQLDAALAIPMGVVYLSGPVSGVFILFYFVCNEIELIKKLKAI